MNAVTDFFANNFSSCIWLAVILLAMIPALESKIAIPFAVASGLSAWTGCLFALIGSLIPCTMSLLIARKIRSRTTGFVTGYIKDKYTAQTNILEKQDGSFKKYFSLACFVALPLPLTGVWAGGFVAGFSSLNIYKSFASVMAGSLCSCLIVTLLCTIFQNSIGYILMFAFGIIALFLIVDLTMSLFKRNKGWLNRSRKVK